MPYQIENVFASIKNTLHNKPGTSFQTKVNFYLHFKFLHNVWLIAIHVWILFCMPFSQQHTELHFGKLFLVEKSRLTPMEEPRLMEMLRMATGKFLYQIYRNCLFVLYLYLLIFLTVHEFPITNSRFSQIFQRSRTKAKLCTFRSIVLHYHFYLPEVDIQVQNGQGVIGSLVPSILDTSLACWGTMAILDLYIFFR